MKRTKLIDRLLPRYTSGEEVFNMTTHIVGGIMYTIGAVLFGIGSRVKYIHSVFHIFVVLASVMHFICILFYTL